MKPNEKMKSIPLLVFAICCIGQSFAQDTTVPSSGNLILDGTNKWIFHTPDDGRTSMFIAPWIGGSWAFDKQIQLFNNGDAQFSQSVQLRNGTTTDIGAQLFGSSGSWKATTGPGYLQMNGSKIFDNGDYLHFASGGSIVNIHSSDQTTPVSIKFNATTNGVSYFNSGNVGIGTTNPQNKLDVNGNIQISNAAIPMGLINELGGNTPILNMSVNFRESNKNNTYMGGAFRVDTRTDNNLFQWLQRSAGTTTETTLMALNQNGNLGIGTTNPNQKLTVNGTIYGKEVKVDLSVPGPDYVFEKEYALPSLESVKTFIDQNKHLPEVPSAKEMEVNGINLSEMNMLLLKKVEELTLYVIEQQKTNEAQSKEIDQLKEIIGSKK